MEARRQNWPSRRLGDRMAVRAIIRPAWGRSRPFQLSGRDGVMAVFCACLAGLLVADLTHWGELADAVFFQATTLTAYYVRPGSLLPVVVSPPLLFVVACAAASVVASPGVADGSLEGALARAAWWMLAGMALTVAIGLLRGLRAEVLALLACCGWPLYLRSSRGSWKDIFSLTASTSSTAPKPSAASFSSTPATRSSGTEAPLVTPTVVASSSQRSSISPASSTR
jgi:Domain of unknown function (DUF6542)